MARHDELRTRLSFFGFVGGAEHYHVTTERWRRGDLLVELIVDPQHPDYRSSCERVTAVLEPLEAAYLRGRQDEAAQAGIRVWEIQDKFDAQETADGPSGFARKGMNLLEDAAHAALGEVGIAGMVALAQEESSNCWCVRCVDEQAQAQRVAGASFSMTLGSMGRMIVCPDCGNKRCPRATWHANECTGSNEPGQPGSRFENMT